MKLRKQKKLKEKVEEKSEVISTKNMEFGGKSATEDIYAELFGEYETPRGGIIRNHVMQDIDKLPKLMQGGFISKEKLQEIEDRPPTISKEAFRDAYKDKDLADKIIKDIEDGKGFYAMGGFRNKDKSINIDHIAITDKSRDELAKIWEVSTQEPHKWFGRTLCICNFIAWGFIIWFIWWAN